MNIPPPLGLARPSRNQRRYQIRMVQQPVRGRSFGFGEKDRRVIDPPPIIQLLYDPDQSVITPSESVLFIVHCDLYSIDKTTNKNVVFVPSTLVPILRNEHEGTNVMSLKEPTKVRNLIGSLTSNAYHLLNENNEMGIYFIFHDLTVRTEGTFILKFMFMDLGSGEPLTMTTNIQSEVFSDPFTIYSAKKFPGLLESTALSRSFAKQGIKISIRNDSRGPKLHHQQKNKSTNIKNEKDDCLVDEQHQQEKEEMDQTMDDVENKPSNIKNEKDDFIVNEQQHEKEMDQTMSDVENKNSNIVVTSPILHRSKQRSDRRLSLSHVLSNDDH